MTDPRRQRRRQQGFTLLEVFVATAILGIAIIYMFDALTHSPDRSNRAKLVTVATMLARTKMIDIEADLLKEGWEDFADEDCGDFADEEYGGLKRFRWCAQIEKIELPENVDVGGAVDNMLGSGGGGSGGGSGSGGSGSVLGQWFGGMGGMPGIASGGSKPGEENPAMSGLGAILASFLAPFRNVVEQAIRRITLRVFWKYRGREEAVTLVYYVTRPELVDQALIGGFMQSMSGSSSGSSGGKSSSSSGGTK